MVFLRFLLGAAPRKLNEILWFSCGPPRWALSENLKKSYGFPEVPPRGPRRKQKEVLWFSWGPPREPSTKTNENPMVCPWGAQRTLKKKLYGFPEVPPESRQRKLEEIK